jgi:dihydrolipoamide dehydrogenase
VFQERRSKLWKADPEDLVIVGGGASRRRVRPSISNALGRKVTIIELLPSILTTVDEELAQRFQQSLHKQGVEVRTLWPIKEVRRGDRAFQVVF